MLYEVITDPAAGGAGHDRALDGAAHFDFAARRRDIQVELGRHADRETNVPVAVPVARFIVRGVYGVALRLDPEIE